MAIQDPGAGQAGGTVHVYADGVEIGNGRPDSNGVVVVQTAALASGSHTITAHYDGDGNTSASDSNSITVVING